MINDADVKVGQYCWAVINDNIEKYLTIVEKADDSAYYFEIGTEVGIYAEQMELIKIIDVPEEYYGMPRFVLMPTADR